MISFIEKIKKHKLEYSLSAISALIMLVLTFFLLESNRTYGDDTFLVKYSSIFKKLILKIDDKPKQDELLFVNVSYDPMLIDKLDADSIPIGQQIITDRSKLARLFKVINQKPDNYKYIFCDVFFKDGSEFDEDLNSQLMKAKNLVIPYHGAGGGNYQLPLFDVNRGFADYDYIEGSFLKFKLLQDDTTRSVPLILFDKINNGKFEKKGLFYYTNNKLCFNNIILDQKVRYYDIIEGMSPNPYPFVHLGEFVSLSDSMINETVKNKILLVGDFLERDMHSTVFGKTPGTIIVLNAYLTLLKGDNVIPFLFFPYLFLCYFYLSFRVFNTNKTPSALKAKIKSFFRFPWKKKEETEDKKKIKAGEVFKKAKIIDLLKQTSIGSFIFKFIGAASVFTLVSFLSYLIFNIHINVLILVLFLEAEKYFYLIYLDRKSLKLNQDEKI
ncbi:MAG: CHASE2 domain-containing protein [Ignavibacteriae bacterium]|nr:CHASE2 domain-containing protein [Ignavibacteriota bacterium]